MNGKIDTLEVSKALQSVGFTQEQSEGLPRVLLSLIEGAAATKTDIMQLEAAIKSEAFRLDSAIAKLEATTREEFLRLEATTREEFLRLEGTTREELLRLEGSTKTDISRLDGAIAEVRGDMKALEHRLTARIYGGQIAVVAGVVGTLKLFGLLAG